MLGEQVIPFKGEIKIVEIKIIEKISMWKRIKGKMREEKGFYQ